MIKVGAAEFQRNIATIRMWRYAAGRGDAERARAHGDDPVAESAASSGATGRSPGGIRDRDLADIENSRAARVQGVDSEWTPVLWPGRAARRRVQRTP